MTAPGKKIVAFGELLLRLDPIGNERVVQADTFKARYTGAEANVAASLACFGIEGYVVSKIPEHEMGQACLNYLRRYGINTDYIVRGGNRLGILYVETGASQRSTKVIYDRDHSSIREVRRDEFDWPRLLDGKHWFHFSGTAPALGPNVIDVLTDALRTAKKVGVKTSCDCNYRSKLWSLDEAGRVLTGLIQYVDVFIGGVEDAEKLFGVKPSGQGDTETDVANQMRNRFGFDCVAMTLRRGESASSTYYAGLLCTVDGCHFSRNYEIQVVDRVGAGDAFSAGIIHGILAGKTPLDTVEFAAASACLKHSIPGDFNLVSEEEVNQLMRGAHGGRVQR
jgi:2-dehydro-3-deoxygluconokinase